MLGDLRLGLFELEYLTHREILNAYGALIKEKDSNVKLAYEVSRWQIVRYINSKVKVQDQINKLTDFAVFSWENETVKNKKLTIEEQLEQQKKIKI